MKDYKKQSISLKYIQTLVQEEVDVRKRNYLSTVLDVLNALGLIKKISNQYDELKASKVIPSDQSLQFPIDNTQQ